MCLRCGGDEATFAWVWGWFAQLVQRPGDKPGTALALRGEEGCGKSIVGEAVGKLLGARHYWQVASPRYVTGQFNSHLESCILLQADEAFWAGDKSAEGVLKDLITGKVRPVERKGVEPIQVANHTRPFVTSNNEWVVPAALRQRRFTMLDVPDARVGDKAYFAAIHRQLNAPGGYGALLRELLRFPADTDTLRTPLRTEALRDQQVRSLAIEVDWWLEVLRDGVLPGALPEEPNAWDPATRSVLVGSLNEPNAAAAGDRRPVA